MTRMKASLSVPIREIRGKPLRQVWGVLFSRHHAVVGSELARDGRGEIACKEASYIVYHTSRVDKRAIVVRLHRFGSGREDSAVL